eukprot:7389850-Prymnesium_polylepis.3
MRPSVGVSKATPMPEALGAPPPPRSIAIARFWKASLVSSSTDAFGCASFPSLDSLGPAPSVDELLVDAFVVDSSCAISTSSSITSTPCSARSVFCGVSVAIRTPAGSISVDAAALLRPAPSDRTGWTWRRISDGHAAAPLMPSRRRSRRSRNESPLSEAEPTLRLVRY